MEYIYTYVYVCIGLQVGWTEFWWANWEIDLQLNLRLVSHIYSLYRRRRNAHLESNKDEVSSNCKHLSVLRQV